MPTKVTASDDKYYAVFNSLTNSTYVLIENSVEFADVTAAWAKDAVDDMGSRMIVMGVGDNEFAPSRVITRAEFVAIMVRALGLGESENTDRYCDVKSTDWYCGYVETASDYGLIYGFGNDTFDPNGKITREQAAVIINRAMALTELDPDLTEDQIATLLSEYEDGFLLPVGPRNCRMSGIRKSFSAEQIRGFARKMISTVLASPLWCTGCCKNPG